MWLISLLLTGLGHDDWAIREQYHAWCDNILFALVSPDTHDDPEVRNRLKQIKRKQLEKLDIERGMYKIDKRRWLTEYVVTGKGKLLSDIQVFDVVMNDLTLCFTIPGCKAFWFVRPASPNDVEEFCTLLKRLRADR